MAESESLTIILGVFQASGHGPLAIVALTIIFLALVAVELQLPRRRR